MLLNKIKELSEKLISTLLKYKSLLIYIKGSPDPDVIASSYTLKMICGALGIKAAIVSTMKPSLPQNSAIINELDIPVHYSDSVKDISEFDAYCVLDFQSAFVEGITGNIPCAVHIDHHEPAEDKFPVDFKLIIRDAGSISSFFALLVQELNDKFESYKSGGLISASSRKLDDSTLKKISTALLYGMFTDTDEYRHATGIDYEALQFVSTLYDKTVIEHIAEIPLPRHIISLMNRAFENRKEYKDWIFAGLDFIDESIRDSIPIIADFIIERFKCSVAIVYAVVIKKKPSRGLRLDASFRTENENIDLNKLIKKITQSGGGRKYKGAYQVDLSYFTEYPDKEVLWKFIESATITNIKNLRDRFKD